MSDDFRMLIDGRLVTGKRAMEVIDPATEEVIATCPHASGEELDRAVEAAVRAFPGWAATPVAERRAALVRVAEIVEANCDMLARLLTREQGKPLAEAAGEVMRTAGFFRFFAGVEMSGDEVVERDSRRIETLRRPLGVVGAIVPWNYPLLLMAFKLPPALLAGNTVVLKPAATTPLTTLRFGELVGEIFPAGVLNVISDRNDLGAAMTNHPGIAKISFTGSTQTGRLVMEGAAATLKRLTLELGGNDAAIVLGDVDPKEAAPKLYAAAFRNSGQVCIAIKRLYVHADIYEEMCRELCALADRARVGNGLDPATEHGPLQNRAQLDKVLELISDSARHGTIVAGGATCEERGYFVRPTIVRDIEDGARLVDEEQFGPVLPVIRFTDSEDAVARANASPFGLGGSVWSSDPEAARALAHRLDVGTAWINKHADLSPDLSFGGVKQSGFGRELGEEGIAEYTQIRIVNAAL